MAVSKQRLPRIKKIKKVIKLFYYYEGKEMKILSNMTNQEILAMVDHTLLKADAKKEDIKKICEEALENNTASICINPGFIEYAVGILGDKIPVCTVIGFPLGAMTTAAKVFEAKDAIEKGAQEVDMVINIGALKDHKDDYVYEEIKYIIINSFLLYLSFEFIKSPPIH